MNALRVLAVAATSRRIGYVFLIGNRLMEWRMAGKPARSRIRAAGALQELINTFHPNVLITEKLKPSDRKGLRARRITEALQRTAAENYILDVSVRRHSGYANKYEEIDVLVQNYPAIKPWAPRKRKHYENEPPAMVLFDALAIADRVLQNPTTTLAAKMN